MALLFGLLAGVGAHYARAQVASRPAGRVAPWMLGVAAALVTAGIAAALGALVPVDGAAVAGRQVRGLRVAARGRGDRRLGRGPGAGGDALPALGRRSRDRRLDAAASRRGARHRAARRRARDRRPGATSATRCCRVWSRAARRSCWRGSCCATTCGPCPPSWRPASSSKPSGPPRSSGAGGHWVLPAVSAAVTVLVAWAATRYVVRPPAPAAP